MKVDRIVLALAAVFAVGMYSSCTFAAVINEFDTGLESWRFDFGAASTIVHDPTEGSPGNPSGAAKMTFNFPGNGIAFTGDVFGSETDLTANPFLSFDVKVDPSSALDAFGNHGYLTFVSRETGGYNWGGQTGNNLPAVGGWQTSTVPTTGDGLGMANTRAFTLQLYGGGSQNIQGPVTLWLDNIRTIPEPTSLGLLAAGCVSLLGYRRRQD